jgi:large subunit ribosomal protein L10
MIFKFEVRSILSRKLATIASPQRLYQPRLSQSQAEEAFKNVHKSKRGNPVEARKIYWYEIYAKILNNSRQLFVLQNNNISAKNYKKMKCDLKEKGLECLAVKNGVFSAAARNLKHENLGNLFQGPSLIWFSSLSDMDAPSMIKDVAGLVEKYPNMLLVGASIDKFVLTADTFKEVKKLPPKSVIYGELFGLISYPSGAIANILSHGPQVLASTLDQHIKQLKE